MVNLKYLSACAFCAVLFSSSFTLEAAKCTPRSTTLKPTEEPTVTLPTVVESDTGSMNVGSEDTKVPVNSGSNSEETIEPKKNSTSVTSAADRNTTSDSGGLCAKLPPTTFTEASKTNYQLKIALEKLSENSIATWYTDRSDQALGTVKKLMQRCDKSSIPVIVIYGLPGKDCEAGFSSGGRNKDANAYKKFVTDLAEVVGDRTVVYVYEPDATALEFAECANKGNYKANLKSGLSILNSKNKNAKLYLDVGHWIKKDQMTGVVKEYGEGIKILKGICLNTSNYRSTEEMVDTCNEFSKGSNGQKCIIDTSRNYQGPAKNSEWCNLKSAGIGHPPTSETGEANVDYFIWVKVAGESDGTCDGRKENSIKGPAAGNFFPNFFTSLWNNGYFVHKENMSKI